MNDIYSMLDEIGAKKQSSERMPKEEYAKMMKEKRQSLYDLSEKQAEIISQNPDKYMHYLKLLGNTDYTPTNTLLVMAQKPDATYLKDGNRWQELKCYRKKGEKGIQILEPKGEYEKKDNSIGTNYAIKYVFDISQLSTSYSVPKKHYTLEQLVRGLTYDTSVELQKSDSLDGNDKVLYSPEAKTIYYENNISQQEMIYGLAREYCYLEFDNQYENMDRTRDKFMVESSAYLLCQKYGIEVPNVNFSKEVSKYFDGMDTQEIKQELANIKELYDDVSKRVDRGIYHFEQNKTVQHNQEVR